MKRSIAEPDLNAGDPSAAPEPVVVAFAARLRQIRARRGLTRKALAQLANVSDRYLANLEHALANPSLAILQYLSQALQCSLAELVGDVTTSSSEWLSIRELLENRSDAELRLVRNVLAERFAQPVDAAAKQRRIAFVGLRGAGKSTLGPRVAQRLDLPFIELSREIERIAGVSAKEIQGLYGAVAYRRYERRALEELLQLHPEFLLATPGGLVSDAASYNMLLHHCTTVWLQASPEDHMSRVALQGDFRPIAASTEAMNDLKQILSGRSSSYSRAAFFIDTSKFSISEATDHLVRLLCGSAPDNSLV